MNNKTRFCQRANESRWMLIRGFGNYAALLTKGDLKPNDVESLHCFLTCTKNFFFPSKI